MLGSALLEKKIISEEQLNEALRSQAKTRDLLGSILVKLGHCLEEDIARIVAEVNKLPFIDLDEMTINPAIIQSISSTLAYKHKIIPIKIEGNTLYFACARPLNTQVTSNLQRLTNKQIAFYVAEDSAVESTLKRYYRSGAERPVSDNGAGQSVSVVLDELLRRALRFKASDVHFETQDGPMRVRFRIDGVLSEAESLSKELALPLISRIKILSGLDIAEKRAPQDGSFVFNDEDESIDIRVSILPNIWGEKAVLRLLSSKKKIITLESLGMEKDTLAQFGSVIKRPHGIILITGPTGSGKSTTLYASLMLIRSAAVNITTVEDPVEYQIEGTTQTQVDHFNKISFAKVLRHILRQDPDIIMVGEIRDKETADIALKAALTGHLVFSTLHTNDAPSALTRLVDMGCEPYLISSTVCAIVAQRLVRLNCEFCKQAFHPTKDELEKFGIQDDTIKRTWYRAPGCRHCQKTGYKGRAGIFELLTVDNVIQKEVIKGSFTQEIKEAALSRGMRTLRQDAFLKVEQGLTSPEEAMRITVAG
jgi:type IV pilus assembly protein PilB